MHNALKNSIWAGMQQSFSSTIGVTRDLWILLSGDLLDQSLVEFLVSVLFSLTSLSGDQIKGSLGFWNKDWGWYYHTLSWQKLSIEIIKKSRRQAIFKICSQLKTTLLWDTSLLLQAQTNFINFVLLKLIETDSKITINKKFHHQEKKTYLMRLKS